MKLLQNNHSKFIVEHQIKYQFWEYWISIIENMSHQYWFIKKETKNIKNCFKCFCGLPFLHGHVIFLSITLRIQFCIQMWQNCWIFNFFELSFFEFNDFSFLVRLFSKIIYSTCRDLNDLINSLRICETINYRIILNLFVKLWITRLQIIK